MSHGWRTKCGHNVTFDESPRSERAAPRRTALGEDVWAAEEVLSEPLNNDGGSRGRRRRRYGERGVQAEVLVDRPPGDGNPGPRRKKLNEQLEDLTRKIERLNEEVEARSLKAESFRKKYEKRAGDVAVDKVVTIPLDVTVRRRRNPTTTTSADEQASNDTKVRFRANFNARLSGLAEPKTNIESRHRNKTSKTSTTNVHAHASEDVSRALERAQAGQLYEETRFSSTRKKKLLEPLEEKNEPSSDASSLPSDDGAVEKDTAPFQVEELKNELSSPSSSQQSVHQRPKSSMLTPLLLIFSVFAIILLILHLNFFTWRLKSDVGPPPASKFLTELSRVFPSQEPSTWRVLKSVFDSGNLKRAPDLVMVFSTAARNSSKTSACLVSHLTNFVKIVHGDRRVHVLDVETFDGAFSDLSAMHVPLFFQFAFENDHSAVVLNFHKLDAVGAGHLKTIFSNGATFDEPAVAFLLAEADGLATLEKDLISRGWSAKNVDFLLKSVGEKVIEVVGEEEVPCSGAEP